jgi:hypothetical protein
MRYGDNALKLRLRIVGRGKQSCRDIFDGKMACSNRPNLKPNPGFVLCIAGRAQTATNPARFRGCHRVFALIFTVLSGLPFTLFGLRPSHILVEEAGTRTAPFHSVFFMSRR